MAELLRVEDLPASLLRRRAEIGRSLTVDNANDGERHNDERELNLKPCSRATGTFSNLFLS